MKTKKYVALVIAVLMTFLSFYACAPQDNPVGAVYYTVTFLLDGGTMPQSVSELEVEKGTRLELQKYKPTKSDYIFSGWIAGETKYAQNDAIVVNADITLTAQWEPVPNQKFIVTFCPEGGTLDGSSADKKVEVEKDAVLDFSDYLPQRQNYIFKGWRAGERVFDGGVYTVVENIEFTAVWEKAPSSDDNFVFQANSDGTGYILKALSEELDTTELVVPAYYDGKPVVGIGRSVFSYNDKITCVDLSCCDKLEEIGDWNFYDCSALVEINSEGCESLKKIGNSCFCKLPLTTKINLKGLSSLTEIGSQSFRGEEKTPLNVTELDFSDCVSLKAIGQMSFWYVGVKELDFSNTQIEDFERQTIHYSTALETLKLPKTLNLTKNSSEFCSRCENLSQIILDPMNIFMTVEDNALMDADKTIIFKYAVKSDAKIYKAPESVKTIMSCAFYKAERLEEIDFMSAHVTEIGYAAFYDCSAAVLKMPFGEDGTYEDGSQSCESANDWKAGVKEVLFGRPAKSFFFETSLIDGLSLTESEFDFTACAKYGPSFDPQNCELKVRLNGAEIVGQEGNFTVSLSDGENTIELIASCDGKTETKTYKVTKTAKAELKTNLTEGVASGIMNFRIWAEVAGQKQDLTGKTLNVLFAWESSNYSGFAPVMGNDVTISYNATEKYFDVSIDIDSINMWYFESACKIKFEIQGYTAEPLVLSFDLE